METRFASPERSDHDDLQIDIGNIVHNPFFDGVLTAASGLVAVLNRHRQVVAVNDSFLDMLGISDPEKVLGLRPGEAIGCIHADETAGGCGTGRFCPSCGAAIAIVTSLRDNHYQERYCAATVRRNGVESDLCLRVQATPLNLDGRAYVLLFLQDVSRLQRWETMERIFFHDLNNLLTALLGASGLLANMPDNHGDLIEKIRQIAARAAREVAVQRSIAREKLEACTPFLQEIRIPALVEELKNTILSHPAAAGKTLTIAGELEIDGLRSDISLLFRVIVNMLMNAFEASPPGGEIRLTVTAGEDSLLISVWNRGGIAEEVQPRVFQRYFSTKDSIGRGFGTYAMKLFGEQFLGGSVSFTSSAEEGTTFHLRLPRGQRGANGPPPAPPRRDGDQPG
ncbi:MAG: PAS domain-containing sensor histidine kinase [Thermodesulfobacteriota bacterium]